MTQNPYATFGSPAAQEFFEPAQRRTSVLAILSLIAGVLCFIPGAGALATIFGGAAVIFISQSRGRLGGLGLAITGIVLGLVFTLFWILAVVGMSNAAQFVSSKMVGPADAMLRGMMTNDHVAGRALLTKKASDSITNAQLDDFAQRVTAELGGYQGTPKSLLELFAGYGEAGEKLQALNGTQDIVPFPAKFDKGMAIIGLQADQAAGKSGGGSGVAVTFPVINVVVLAGTPPNIKQIWLISPADATKLKQWYTPTETPPSGVPSAPGAETPEDPESDNGPKTPEAPAAPTPP